MKEKRNAVTPANPAPGETQLSEIQEICWGDMR